ncbi:uncharacterized protein LOC133706717 [Rosa rugosa]|uniref:uncharacterized protein LOC133706717 n=1 Tax=Rosa rugosa TaxID=74645 RepID=UPI002B40CD52|nr:uncharacterized protein LOC133706717 [Rosa rugosa]
MHVKVCGCSIFLIHTVLDYCMELILSYFDEVKKVGNSEKRKRGTGTIGVSIRNGREILLKDDWRRLEEPYGSIFITIPTVLDSSLAPAGHRILHIYDLFH